MIEKFIEEAKKVGVETYRFSEREELRRFIINFLWKNGEHKLLIKKSELLQSLRLDKYLELVSLPDDNIKIGVSEADYGIAFSGSIVEFFDNDNEKFPSLLPDIHISVLKADNIVEDYSDLFIKVNNRNDFLFITGPSKTADIEKIVVNGAHGPKKLIVLILL